MNGRGVVKGGSWTINGFGVVAGTAQGFIKSLS